MPRRAQSRAFWEAGLPLLLLVGGGFFGLTYFLEGLNEVKVRDYPQQTAANLKLRA